MSPQRKHGVRSSAPNVQSSATQRVLEACTQLPLWRESHTALRSYIAETARDTLQALVAGMLVREDETYVLGSLSSEGNPDLSKSSLISHAKGFAIQAIEKKKLLNFSLSSSAGTKSAYYGLAGPLITSQSATVLVVLRSEPFSDDEISAFDLLGNMGRLALDNVELTNLATSQQQHLNQLLAISTELSDTSHLDSFLSKFVVRAAEFLGFHRVFVALVEGGECRVRWGCINGVANPMNVEISTASTRRLLESKQTYVTEDINESPPGDDKSKDMRSAYRMQQYVGIPLLTSDGLSLGILGLLDKKDETRVGDSDVARAKALAAEIAVALEASHNLHLS